jgi:hypothetical protein
VHTDYALTILVALLTSIAFPGVVVVFLIRREHKRDLEERREDDERRSEAEAKTNEELRRKLAVETQEIAHRSAIASANERYETLEKDYDACRSGLVELREAAALVIDVFERFLVRMRPKADSTDLYSIDLLLSDIGDARRAINETRRHMR